MGCRSSRVFAVFVGRVEMWLLSRPGLDGVWTGNERHARRAKWTWAMAAPMPVQVGTEGGATAKGGLVSV